MNRGHIDGIDFVVGCSNRFTVSTSVNGAPIAESNVSSAAVRSTRPPCRSSSSVPDGALVGCGPGARLGVAATPF